MSATQIISDIGAVLFGFFILGPWLARLFGDRRRP